jgi:hypothetical protein
MPILAGYQPEVAPKAHVSPFVPTQYQVCPLTSRCESHTYDRFPRLTAPRIIRCGFIVFVIQHHPQSSDRPPTSLSQQIVVYTVVIFAVWNIPALRNLINPLKLFTIGWHELCHIIVVSVSRPGVYYQSTSFLNAFIGCPDRRNDIESLYRSEHWWMYQS